MKVLCKIAIVISVISLLSSCTQRNYGHLTGFQFNKSKSTDNSNNRGHFVQKLDTSWILNVASRSEMRKEAVGSASLAKMGDDSKNNGQPFALKQLPSEIKKNSIENRGISESNNRIKGVAPIQVLKKAKDSAGKEGKGDLIYWILVIVLVLLIITLLKSVLGPELYGLLILVILIALVGHLLGLW